MWQTEEPEDDDGWFSMMVKEQKKYRAQIVPKTWCSDGYSWVRELEISIDWGSIEGETGGRFGGRVDWLVKSSWKYNVGGLRALRCYNWCIVTYSFVMRVSINQRKKRLWVDTPKGALYKYLVAVHCISFCSFLLIDFQLLWTGGVSLYDLQRGKWWHQAS